MRRVHGNFRSLGSELMVQAHDPGAFWEGFCPNCHVPLAGDCLNWCPGCRVFWVPEPVREVSGS